MFLFEFNRLKENGFLLISRLFRLEDSDAVKSTVTEEHTRANEEKNKNVL